MVCGLSQVLSLGEFTNPKCGYIFEGERCEFGVDVMIASPYTKWDVVSFDDTLSFPKFYWSVKNFSVLKENFYISNSFSVGVRKWNLKLFPEGDNRANGKWLSIFLNLDGTEILKAEEKIYVRAFLKVIDPRGSDHFTKTIHNWYTESNKGWGVVEFLSSAKLQEAYLDVEDTLNVEVEFKVVSATKQSA